MSQIPLSKIESIQKNYTDQLDEFLNISMSDIQVKQWTIALSKYNEDVLREGWSKFIFKVRPGLMPSIEDCTNIMDVIQMEHSRQVHEANKKEAPAPPPGADKGFTRWMKAITYGLRMRSSGRWTEAKRKQYMIDEGKQCGLPKRDITDLEIELAEYKRRNPNVEESPI